MEDRFVFDGSGGSTAVPSKFLTVPRESNSFAKYHIAVTLFFTDLISKTSTQFPSPFKFLRFENLIQNQALNSTEKKV